MHRPFAQRYAILLANGRGAYQPLDLDSMEQRQLAEAVRKILQAAGLDGWQVRPHQPFPALTMDMRAELLARYKCLRQASQHGAAHVATDESAAHEAAGNSCTPVA